MQLSHETLRRNWPGWVGDTVQELIASHRPCRSRISLRKPRDGTRTRTKIHGFKIHEGQIPYQVSLSGNSQRADISFKVWMVIAPRWLRNSPASFSSLVAGRQALCLILSLAWRGLEARKCHRPVPTYWWTPYTADDGWDKTKAGFFGGFFEPLNF